MQEKARKIAALLKVLANENRLMILCVLMEQPMTVSRISEKVPSISQSALSQHLSLMKAHGILNSSKSGQNITYFVADHRVNEVINVLKKHYCDTENL
jgi:DNA-binding transcriptional ArsR family regulator